MPTTPTKYICNNAACEIYYYASKTTLNSDEAIPGDSNESCCPKCGQPLLDYAILLKEETDAKKRKFKKLFRIGLVIVVIFVIVIAILKLIGKKDNSQLEQTTSKSVKVDSTPAVKDAMDPPPHEVKESKVSTPVLKDESEGSVSNKASYSVEQYFEKLADPSIKNKTALKSGILSLFTSANAPVIKMNNGQPTNDGTKIGDYIESISVLNKRVTVTGRESSNGKISKIYISEK